MLPFFLFVEDEESFYLWNFIIFAIALNKLLMKIKTILVLFAACIVLWTACKRDPNQERWDTNILAPLVNSTLTLENLIGDSLVKTNADSTVSLVYRNNLYNLTLDTLLHIPDTTLPVNSYGLSGLSIANQNVVYALSLGQIDSSANHPEINALNGWPVIIPPFAPVAGPTNIINVDTLFQTMHLIQGQMIITIRNELPITIDSVRFTLFNQGNMTDTIATGYFDSIPSNSQQSRISNLAGKTVNSHLVAVLDSIHIPGSYGHTVTIDTSKKITTTLSIVNIIPDSATAFFPAQDLIKQTNIIPFKAKDAQLTKIIAKEGMVNIDAYNTLPDTLYFQYILPGARLNNVIFKALEKLPPAVNNVASHVHRSYNLAGYTIDLKGPNEDTVNTFYFNLLGSIQATGQLQTLTTRDSIRLQTSFTGLVPTYAKGYLGRDTIEVGPASIPVTVFNRITGGMLNVHDVKMSISVQNGIGADGRVIINNIQAVNTRTGNSATLTTHVNANAFDIARATETGNQSNPVNIGYSSLMLDRTNSNDTALVNVIPNLFNYDLKLFIDPNGNTSNFNDFMYSTSTLNATLDLEVPLIFMSNQLELSDTATFALGTAANADRIKQGTFYLNVDNGFPLDGVIQMYLLNPYGYVIDSLFSTNNFTAAPLGINGIVRQQQFSKLTIPVSEAKMKNVLTATKAIIKVRFTSKPSNQKVRIYSDYKIALKLVGDFTYKVQ